MRPLARRIRDALAGTPFAGGLAPGADLFLERRAGDAAAGALAGGALRGVARVLATETETARLLARRPHLLERVAAARPGALEARAHELGPASAAPEDAPLEDVLDALRLFRREETAFAACLDLGGLESFDAVSAFLSRVAEAVVERALATARIEAARGRAGLAERPFAVIGMGKIAGREFTYHSDLDLLFLYGNGAEQIEGASRTAQRLTSYLTTPTGAGVAYKVDTRLRPSGHQGTLVTSLAGFESYQRREAETWEHLAIMRARAIAGDVDAAGPVLERTRAAVLARAAPPWEYVADLRGRVLRERGEEKGSRIAFKAGRGGLMDLEFLAAGALLERARDAAPPAFPSVPAMLAAAGHPEAERRLLSAYALLRTVEARARWTAGRPVEHLRGEERELSAIAELVEPGLDPEALRERMDAARRTLAAAFEAVVEAGSIDALGRAA